MTNRCGRCGNVKPLTQSGPYKNMMCDDCASTKQHEEEVSREQVRRRVRFDRCHTMHHEILIPDIEIKEDKPEYVYVPLRGSPHTMAVYGLNDALLGWIKCETLGHQNVSEWMKATKWVDQGY